MGKIITLSGPDLVGKSLQADLLSRTMNATLHSYPNYDDPVGQLIRAHLEGKNRIGLTRETMDGFVVGTVYDYIENKGDPNALQCLYAYQKINDQGWLDGELSLGDVVFDRYDVDAYIYGSADGCHYSWLVNLMAPIRRSDLVVILQTEAPLLREGPLDSNDTNVEYRKKIRELFDSPMLGFSLGYNIARIDVPEIEPIDSIIKTHSKICEAVCKSFGEDYAVPLADTEVKRIYHGRC